MIDFRLRQMRERAGMTEPELAALLGHDDPMSICEIEAGISWPTWELATDIAIALGCTLDELAGIEGDTESVQAHG